MKDYIKKNLLSIILIVFILVLPILSLATDANTKIENPIGSGTIPEVIHKILEGVIKIGMPIIVLAVIYCGFLFVSARGKPEDIKKAKDALLYTLIGAAILLGSWGIAQLITETVKAL